jgi:hypothetical protein
LDENQQKNTMRMNIAYPQTQSNTENPLNNKITEQNRRTETNIVHLRKDPEIRRQTLPIKRI